MKILWFEVTIPSAYQNGNNVLAGWQDSLEDIVRSEAKLELYIAFEATSDCRCKVINNVTYIPVHTKDKLGFFSRQKNKFTWKYNQQRVVEAAIKVIEDIKPDIIHIFGMEWSWAAVAKYTNIPCVVHIMGSIVPYYNALYPPRYNEYDIYKSLFPNIKAMINYWIDLKKQESWRDMEIEKWKNVVFYMGRTDWDYSLMSVLHPNAQYYHVEEALRPQFLSGKNNWCLNDNDKKLRLISTGCSTFWKGPDMTLKVASILKNMGIDFEWKIAGKFPNLLKKVIERKEKLLFKDCNITFVGFTKPEDLAKLLCNSSMYVHTAYIENSPNSICEAQIMGVPIVSTNVGGVSSLVRDCGMLVPANDPWQMVFAILKVANNKELAMNFSVRGRELALKRHNPQNILNQLKNCYDSIYKQNNSNV